MVQALQPRASLHSVQGTDKHCTKEGTRL
jgi:hypothetical protein